MKNVKAFWQTTPCPVWCTGDHRDTDYTEDRFHRAGPDIGYVHLTTEDPVIRQDVNGESYRIPAAVKVDLEQHFLEVAPRVLLGEDNAAHLFSLTLDEAEEIGQALIEAARMGRCSATVGASSGPFRQFGSRLAEVPANEGVNEG